jgi:hypothetical protein
MPEPLSSAEINRQHAELLPARTVLSPFSMQEPSNSGNDKGGAKPANSPLVILTLFDHQTNTSAYSGD